MTLDLSHVNQLERLTLREAFFLTAIMLDFVGLLAANCDYLTVAVTVMLVGRMYAKPWH